MNLEINLEKSYLLDQCQTLQKRIFHCRTLLIYWFDTNQINLKHGVLLKTRTIVLKCTTSEP